LEEIIILETSKLVIASQPIKDAQKEDRDKLLKSIKEVGLLYPLLVRPIKGNKYEVLDGRTRLEILRKIGHATVKCVIRRDEDVKDAVIPYDVETCRRHLTQEEIENFEKIRQQKKQEAERDLISRLIIRLPRRFQRKAEKYVETIPDMSKRLCIDFLATMAEPDLELFFERNEREQKYAALEKKKISLEIELKKFEAEQDERVAERCKEIEAEITERMKKYEQRGIAIPKDEEEKTALIKKIEASVREDFKEQLELYNMNLCKNEEQQNRLRKEIADKEEKIRQLKEREDVLEDHVGMLDDIREHFNIMLSKSIDIKPITSKIRVFHLDLDAFSGRLHEWRNRPNVSGRGIFDEDMTEENIYLLGQELSVLKKKISEIQSQLKQ